MAIFPNPLFFWNDAWSQDRKKCTDVSIPISINIHKTYSSRSGQLEESFLWDCFPMSPHFFSLLQTQHFSESPPLLLRAFCTFHTLTVESLLHPISRELGKCLCSPEHLLKPGWCSSRCLCRKDISVGHVGLLCSAAGFYTTADRKRQAENHHLLIKGLETSALAGSPP